MNIFRFIGDMSHLAAVLVLVKMAKRGQASGISLKAQELYMVVYCTRYLDLFITWYSLYNTCMKIFYILATGIILCILRSGESWHTSYSPAHDSVQHWKHLASPTFLIALVHAFSAGAYAFNFMELLWTYSIMLEAVAMWPQLVMFRDDKVLKGNQGESKDEILIPIFLFGIYRAFYILNWIYRWNTEPYYRHHFVVYICGVIQALLYSSFFQKCCKQSVCLPKDSTDNEAGLETPLVSSDDDVSGDDDTKVQNRDRNTVEGESDKV